MMSVQTIMMNQKAMSLRDTIDMNDPGNIFIGSASMANWMFDLLHAKLLTETSSSTRIHSHFPSWQPLNPFLTHYNTLAMLGAHVYMWITSLPASPASSLRYVLIPEDSLIAEQSFLVIDSPSYARALLTWHNTDDVQQGGYSVLGVLVTNPVLSRRLCRQLDMMVNQS